VQVLLTAAVRSPMCSPASAGGLSVMTAVDLMSQTVDVLLERAGIEAADVDRVIVECANEASDELEAAGWLTWPVKGRPTRIPAITVGRWCGTGQQVVHLAARGVARGIYDAVVVVGVESIRRNRLRTDGAEPPAAPFVLDGSSALHSRILAAELLASKWEIDRQQLDDYAVRSHQRAAEVASSGEFDAEIVPIDLPGKGAVQRVDRDGMIEPTLTVEQLSALQPSFLGPSITSQHPGILWSVTARNSAPHAVGSSAVLLMSKPRAAQLGVRARARFHEFCVIREDPALPLAAPLRATEKILNSAKMSLTQIDHVEVDEEFACVPLVWRAEYPISRDLLNPRGGALSLGNARTCGGIRQITTMLGALEATGGRFGLQTMSATDGKAYASLVECC
jgi:acetyl-CoA acyltransferase